MELREKKDRGFTLIELMVVVAVIGILSSIAVPQYRKYIAKSRTTEAKMALVEIHTLEQTVFSNYGTFVSCLIESGLSYDSRTASMFYRNGYYMTGVHYSLLDGDATWGNAYVRSNFGTALCPNYTAGSYYNYLTVGEKGLAGNMAGASCGGLGTAYYAAVNVTQSATNFVAAAAAAIRPGLGTNCASWAASDIDVWTINQDKKIIHNQIGY